MQLFPDLGAKLDQSQDCVTRRNGETLGVRGVVSSTKFAGKSRKNANRKTEKRQQLAKRRRGAREKETKKERGEGGQFLTQRP